MAYIPTYGHTHIPHTHKPGRHIFASSGGVRVHLTHCSISQREFCGWISPWGLSLERALRTKKLDKCCIRHLSSEFPCILKPRRTSPGKTNDYFGFSSIFQHVWLWASCPLQLNWLTSNGISVSWNTLWEMLTLDVKSWQWREERICTEQKGRECWEPENPIPARCLVLTVQCLWCYPELTWGIIDSTLPSITEYR